MAFRTLAQNNRKMTQKCDLGGGCTKSFVKFEGAMSFSSILVWNLDYEWWTFWKSLRILYDGIKKFWAHMLY